MGGVLARHQSSLDMRDCIYLVGEIRRMSGGKSRCGEDVLRHKGIERAV